MPRLRVPVENAAELLWGILLLIYLVGAGREEFLRPPVLAVFGVSALTALVEAYLRFRGWRWINQYESVVWPLLLSAMVAVTGGRTSELWPAFILLSLTAPAVANRLWLYGLLTFTGLMYATIYLTMDGGAPPQPALLVLRIGLFFLVAYVVERSMERERAARGEVVKAAQTRVRELVAARDVERRRIAGDIHDWLGTGIVAPMRTLELAVRAPELDTARQRITTVIDTLRGSHDELRRLMENLHPHLLEQLGLTQALDAFVTQWGAQHGVAVEFEGKLTKEPPADLSLALFRILQESLNNAAKHAHALSVTVALHAAATQVELSVRDHGVGFDAPAPGGRGLMGMRERAAVFGGTVRITSARGEGTVVEALIPLPNGENA